MASFPSMSIPKSADVFSSGRSVSWSRSIMYPLCAPPPETITSAIPPYPWIGDHRDAGPLGDDRRFADLHGARYLVAEKFHRLAFMKNRLSMRSDQLNGLERYTTGPQSLRKELSDQEVHARNLRRMCGCVGNCEYGGTDLRRIWNALERQYF